MRAFIVIWLGQAASLLGTNMTTFALTIWAFEQTGRATDLALISFFFVVPLLIVSPFAGVMVDRSNRKLTMMISDLASGIVTIIIFLLLISDNLQIWHLYITSFLAGTFQTFQWPAYSAAITTMLPKEHYGRANGLVDLANSASGIFAPMLAGAMLVFVSIKGVLIVDIITFVVAVGSILFVHIPQPARTKAGQEGRGSVWRESVYGFHYILRRPSLLGLQLVFLGANFFGSMTRTLLAPMLLARTGNNELIFGSVKSVAAIGGVVGALLMSTWGGPKRLVHGVLLAWLCAGLFGRTLMGVGMSLYIWAMAGFFMAFFSPIINGSNQAIWQAKVAPDVQGRVFAVRRLIAWIVIPFANLLVGPLADLVFEPAMAVDGNLAGAFGWLVGTGPGAGMALIMVFAGLAIALIAASGYLFPVVRNAEDILLDYD
ncbi:MAG: MFS transporter [Chloroflexi bacterium]|nr:MFS transporter [Chloroflexota bacterium]